MKDQNKSLVLVIELLFINYAFTLASYSNLRIGIDSEIAIVLHNVNLTMAPTFDMNR